MSSSGVHAMRLSDVAMRMSGTLKYIQYIPPSFVAMTRLPSTRARIAPDFDSRSRYLPPYAWIWNRSPVLGPRSEEHTSELQSHSDLVCRLLLEKKKKRNNRCIKLTP